MGRPAKPKSANNVKDTKPIEETRVNVAVDEEKEALKRQVEEQRKQMEELMAQMKLMADMVSNKTPVVEKPVNEKKNITFVNMVKGGMNIKGTRYYHMKNQFETKVLPETEARVVLNNMPNAIQSGLLYITDKEFVVENGLEDYYDGLINDKTLKTLLEKRCDEVVEIYNNANPEQKKIILDMVVARKLNGERIDANIVVELGELCGKDLQSIERLEDDQDKNGA